MLTMLRDWLTAERRRGRERALVADLLRLNDHLLADVGVRRDQLQPDGIHALDVAPARSAARQRSRPVRPVPAPSLLGCG